MEPTYLGLSAVGWHAMITQQWELVSGPSSVSEWHVCQRLTHQCQILAYIILGVFALALTHLLWVVVRASIKSYKVSISRNPMVSAS